MTILTSQVFFFFKASDHSDTDIVTTGRTTGADKGNQTVHTHATRRLEQTRGIKLSFVCCLLSNAVRSVRICGVTSWNGSMTNTAWLRSTHRRCFSWWNLVWIGKCGELEQIVNIPVTQFVEGERRVEYSSSTERGRDRRGEQILD